MTKSFERFLESSFFSLGSCFFFTLGYLSNVRIPETPSISEAGYFFLKLCLASPVALYSCIIFLPLILVYLFSSTRSKAGKIPPKYIFLYFIPVIIFLLLELVCPDCRALPKTFTIVCLLLAIGPTYLLALVDLKIFKGFRTVHKISFLLFIPILIWILSYELSKKYSANFLVYSDIQTVVSEKKTGTIAMDFW